MTDVERMLDFLTEALTFGRLGPRSTERSAAMEHGRDALCRWRVRQGGDGLQGTSVGLACPVLGDSSRVSLRGPVLAPLFAVGGGDRWRQDAVQHRHVLQRAGPARAGRTRCNPGRVDHEMQPWTRRPTLPYTCLLLDLPHAPVRPSHPLAPSARASLAHFLQIEAFSAAVKADRYFAVAYFQRGVHQLAKKVPSKAVQDFNYAADVSGGRGFPRDPCNIVLTAEAVHRPRVQYLRGNAMIDYTQLGMPFRLYYCEVVYNRALTNKQLNYIEDATEDIGLAKQSKMDKAHMRIDDAMPGLVRAACAVQLRCPALADPAAALPCVALRCPALPCVGPPRPLRFPMRCPALPCVGPPRPLRFSCVAVYSARLAEIRRAVCGPEGDDLPPAREQGQGHRRGRLPGLCQDRRRDRPRQHHGL